MNLIHIFEISEAAFNLLKEIEKVGYAEYRDPEFENLEEYFKKVKDSDFLTKEEFLSRNFGGTYYLVDGLLKFNLIESDSMSWHTTFVVTEIGKEILKQNFKH